MSHRVTSNQRPESLSHNWLLAGTAVLEVTCDSWCLITVCSGGWIGDCSILDCEPEPYINPRPLQEWGELLFFSTLPLFQQSDLPALLLIVTWFGEMLKGRTSALNQARQTKCQLCSDHPLNHQFQVWEHRTIKLWSTQVTDAVEFHRKIPLHRFEIALQWWRVRDQSSQVSLSQSTSW